MKGKRGDRPDTAETKTAAAPDEKPAETPATETKGAAAPAGERWMPEQFVKETLKHEFTTAELAELADRMGLAAANVYRIEREKAEQTAHYASELKTANLTHAELVTKYNLRYEMREVECKIVYDRPEPGYKTCIREDNGKIVREVPMTATEKQKAFVFDDQGSKPQ